MHTFSAFLSNRAIISLFPTNFILHSKIGFSPFFPRKFAGLLSLSHMPNACKKSIIRFLYKSFWKEGAREKSDEREKEKEREIRASRQIGRRLLSVIKRATGSTDVADLYFIYAPRIQHPDYPRRKAD